MTRRVQYLGMGPWPFFVGFTTDAEAFAREMKRLKVGEKADFVANAWSDASTHFLHRDSGTDAAIICMPPIKRRPVSQYAALLAHEATHVVQEMRERLGELGREAEAYIVQRIVQEGLLIAMNTPAKIRERPSA